MSSLPSLIPAQTVPLSEENGAGQQIIDVNWYLFFYNIWKNTLQASAGGTALPPSVNIALTETDVESADIAQAYRIAANVALAQPLEQDVSATPRDVANSYLTADALLPDPSPAAQPLSIIAVGGSPYTFTAPFNGNMVVTGGTVSAVAIVRQGTSVSTGLIAGIFPLSRSDKLTITHTGAPTATFLPS